MLEKVREFGYLELALVEDGILGFVLLLEFLLGLGLLFRLDLSESSLDSHCAFLLLLGFVNLEGFLGSGVIKILIFDLGWFCLCGLRRHHFIFPLRLSVCDTVSHRLIINIKMSERTLDFVDQRNSVRSVLTWPINFAFGLQSFQTVQHVYNFAARTLFAFTGVIPYVRKFLI